MWAHIFKTVSRNRNLRLKDNIVSQSYRMLNLNTVAPWSSQSVITCTSLIRSSWSYFRHLFHHSMANSTGMEGCWRKICWWLQLQCASLTRSCFAGLDHQISCFVWGSFTFPRLNMKSPPVPHHQRGRHRRAFPVTGHQSGPEGGCAVLDVGEGEGMFCM